MSDSTVITLIMIGMGVVVLMLFFGPALKLAAYPAIALLTLGAVIMSWAGMGGMALLLAGVVAFLFAVGRE